MMTEKAFKTPTALAAYAAEHGLDFEQTTPKAIEGEYLYSRYCFIQDGLVVGHGIIDPCLEDDVSAIELVAFAYRCPGCGERHIDNLVWIDDETVKCATCGALYDPNEEV